MTRSQRPGLNEMRDRATRIADRLYGTERARVKSGGKPDLENLRDVETLDALGDLLARMIPVHTEVSKVIKQVSIAPYRRDPL